MAKEQVIRDGNFTLTEVWTTQQTGGLLSLLISCLYLGPIIGLLKAWLASKRWHLKITNERIEFVVGMLGTKQESIEFYRAKDSDYSQTLLQKIFGVGNVRIISGDATLPEVVFPTSNPNEIRDQIRGFIRDQRKEMGTAARD